METQVKLKNLSIPRWEDLLKMWKDVICFGSQDVILESRPSCFGKSYPIKCYVFISLFVIGSLGYFDLDGGF